MPIFQILLMVLYLRAAPRLRAWFDRPATPGRAVSHPQADTTEAAE